MDTGTENWSPWRKKPGSEIEQRTEFAGQSATNFDQHDDHAWEYSQFEQQANQRFPSTPVGSQDQEQKTKDPKEKQNRSEGRISQTGLRNDKDIYEGIPPDSTVNILIN